MTPDEKTKLTRWGLDFLITFVVVLLVALHCPWWVIPLVCGYGWWNYYDGKTRRRIFDE
jgi:hypothetical protein